MVHAVLFVSIGHILKLERLRLRKPILPDGLVITPGLSWAGCDYFNRYVDEPAPAEEEATPAAP